MDQRNESYYSLSEEAKDLYLAPLNKELLVEGEVIRATLTPVVVRSFSVGRYEFRLERRDVNYVGDFFVLNQNDIVFKSRVCAYDSSGQQIAEVNLASAITPEPAGGIEMGLYRTDEIALDALLSVLTPVFWKIENDVTGQGLLFE